MRCECPFCDCYNSCYDILITTCDTCLTCQQNSQIKAIEYGECFCPRKRENCTYCKQHRGTPSKFEKCVIKQEYLGGKFKIHDPEDMFGYELNMYSQRILKKLV